MKNKIYIAYGSNLNLKQMKYRCPDSKVLGTAMLRDYELEFRGVATIVPKKGASVPVLLWEISPQDEKSLDCYEGFPNLYRKEKYETELNGQKITGMAYVMNKGQISAPNIGYLNTILQGYRENHLDVQFLNTAVNSALTAERLAETEEAEEISGFQMKLT
ncbi:MAG: gamma-glutamylcyclotransferase [Ruminococcus sp.]|nr:gamma-glutamylcyclotransferase [Ruminococcus sp.]